METLEEFDSEYPLVLSFCERISPQDYEGQGLSYTQRSLQELFTQMERKPSICERVVRKRKQAENERGSLGQYLKVRLQLAKEGTLGWAEGCCPHLVGMQQRLWPRAKKSAQWSQRCKQCAFKTERAVITPPGCHLDFFDSARPLPGFLSLLRSCLWLRHPSIAERFSSACRRAWRFTLPSWSKCLTQRP